MLTIDLRWIRSEQIDGIARYTIGLSRALQKENLDISFLYHKKELLPFLKESFGEANFTYVPYDILTLADWFKLPTLLKKTNPHFYLTPHFVTSPWHGNYKVISIVHDLIPFMYRDTLTGATRKLRLFYRFPVLARMMIRRADILVANSQSTKNDLIKMFQVAEDKISVLYPGIDYLNVTPKKEGQYILYLGRMDPYKNISSLITSYANLPDDLKNKYPLVIAGSPKEPYLSQLKDIASNLGITGQVKFSGFVTEEDLPDLYAKSVIFTYPSLYEGFGLPVLEARARGLPVVTSNTSSLPEAAGKGALLVDPLDSQAITEAMRRLLTDGGLRQELISYNKDLSSQFNWARSARKLRDLVYEKSA